VKPLAEIRDIFGESIDRDMLRLFGGQHCYRACDMDFLEDTPERENGDVLCAAVGSKIYFHQCGTTIQRKKALRRWRGSSTCGSLPIVIKRSLDKAE
jgi:hypothetical protein